mgnify:CR=1 FL=1
MEEKGDNKYLPIVNEYYNLINTSNDVKLVRLEFDNYLKAQKRKLKSKRIKKYNIKEDELTGKNIDIRTCEFSHIRSVSMYQEYSDNIENGLYKCLTISIINPSAQKLKLLIEKLKWNDI